jgi:hypothetical protein
VLGEWVGRARRVALGLGELEREPDIGKRTRALENAISVIDPALQIERFITILTETSLH